MTVTNAMKFTKSLQYGKETAHGTHVAATDILIGADAPIPADIQGYKPNYNLGVRVKNAESGVLYKAVESLPITMQDTYFQHLHLPLALCLKGGVSGVEQASGQHDYKAVYTPGLTSATADSMDSVTLEICDSLRQIEIGYVMARSVKFTWTFGKDGKMTCEMDCFGDYVDNGITKTAGLTVPTHNNVNPNLLKFYADALFANAGTTLLTGILRQVTLEIIGGANQSGPHGNSLFPNAHKVNYLDYKLGLVLEDNSDAADFYTWYRAQTAVAIRLFQDGPAIGTGANHSLKFDLWCVPDEASPMAQEEDGQFQMPVTMSALYNTTSSAALVCELVTDKQAI